MNGMLFQLPHPIHLEAVLARRSAQCEAPRDRVQATVTTATAHTPIGIHGDVSDFPGAAIVPAIQNAVHVVRRSDGATQDDG
jgi:hypothetical protein